MQLFDDIEVFVTSGGRVIRVRVSRPVVIRVIRVPE